MVIKKKKRRNHYSTMYFKFSPFFNFSVETDQYLLQFFYILFLKRVSEKILKTQVVKEERREHAQNLESDREELR